MYVFLFHVYTYTCKYITEILLFFSFLLFLLFFKFPTELIYKEKQK